MAGSPGYWGRGGGKTLLRRGLEENDRAGQDVYLQASPAAVRLYRSCEVEAVEALELPGGEVVMTATMRRHKAVV